MGFDSSPQPTGTPDYGVDQTIYADYPQSGYPAQKNSPSLLFSTNGMFTEDEENRGYEDMGNEPGGNGMSKTPFFLNNACKLNNYTWTQPGEAENPNNGGLAISKCLGNLYALGHSGLICMGTADDNHPGDSYSPFTTCLVNGLDFGQAFLAQQNSYPWGPFYSLLGAGSLRAQPYVQYNSAVEQNLTITTSQSPLTLSQPFFIQNVTVSGSGSWSLTSNNSAAPPGPGTKSEIVVLPECDLAGEVDLKAN
jgi:hypothetical protein